MRARPPVAGPREGIFLVDSDGRRYLDACGGAAVSCLGHGHPGIAAAIAEQTARLEFVHTGFFTSDAAEELAALISGMSPGLDRVWYTSSGSEAVEAALKLARQYHLEQGDTGRSRVIARRLSYHGNTLGALAAGGSRMAARALHTAADRRIAHRSVLRISLCGAGRERRSLWA
jgi:adenosylmethionine-8-amino-7-oxononanoate aminotransferase